MASSTTSTTSVSLAPVEATPDATAAILRLEAQIEALSGELHALKTAIQPQKDSTGGGTSDSTGSGTASGIVLREGEEDECKFKDDDFAEDMKNMFTYATHMLIRSDCRLIDSLSAFAFLFTMVVCKVVLALGFLDSSWLDIFTGQLPALGDKVQRYSFYPDSAMARSEQVLTTNFIAAIVGLTLLAVNTKSETRETMLTSLPIEQIVYFDNWASIKQRPLRMLFGLLCMLVLQLLWAFRILVVPAASLFGAALALSASDSTTDIVLNSVAIAFLFDIDAGVYKALVSSGQRSSFEANPLPPSKDRYAPHHASACPSLISVYSWIIMIFDLILCTELYLRAAGRPSDLPPLVSLKDKAWWEHANPSKLRLETDSSYWVVYDYVDTLLLIRSVLFAAFHTHVALATRYAQAADEGTDIDQVRPAQFKKMALGMAGDLVREAKQCKQFPQTRFLLRMLVVVGVVLTFGIIGHEPLYRKWFWPDDQMSWTSNMDSNSHLAQCAFQVQHNTSCNVGLDSAKLNRCPLGMTTCTNQDMDQSWRNSDFTSMWGTGLDFNWFP